MALDLSALWNWNGTTRRGTYLGWGLALMAIKYNVDRIVAASMSSESWAPGRYWKLGDARAAFIPGGERTFYLTLLYVALPFIFLGVVLTLRRLRDAGWPLWQVVLFFVPLANLLFFGLLCIAPSHPRSATAAAEPPRSFWWQISDPWLSALLGVGLTAALVVPLVMLSTVFLQSYGIGLFVGLPFLMGLLSALIHSMAARRSLGACCLVAVFATMLAGALILVLALEGAICLIMAAPLALPLAVLGGAIGYAIQSSRWSARETGRLYGMAWMAFPLLLYVESINSPARPLLAATTSVVIAASPPTVWRHVVTFSDLPPPRDFVFRSGIAYPVRARIWGHGVGAVRHCEFSTGPFVEPITVWDEPRRLAFDVVKQPEPMRELSPYSNLHPPHLDGFFRSRRGQFVLTALPDGRTQLEGTTWYDQNLWPNRYWKIWSDFLVHRIHQRVLEHIKAETEAERG